jgi:uncharacterized membrane protein
MLYNVLLFVHILAAIIWIGGAIQLNLLGTRASGPAMLSGWWPSPGRPNG